MQSKYLLKNIARFAEPGDNVEIGLKKLESVTKIWGDNGDFFVLHHKLKKICSHRESLKEYLKSNLPLWVHLKFQ